VSLILISSERFAEHQTPPGHPECPERAEVMDVIAAAWRRSGGESAAPHAATGEQLARVHSGEYLSRIAQTAGSAVALDPDTYTSPETYQVALLAAGAAVEAVERVLGASDPGRRPRPSGSGATSAPPARPEHPAAARVLALVRPPGHHAERSRAMGFCLYNNIAVAAAHARSIGVERVAIVDYDVHHGNGTQHMFENDPSVLYVSTHQFPYYPGTGAAEEIGTGAARGFTVNVPIEVGATDEDYRRVFEEAVTPVVRQFDPGLVLVSAGFDAHECDPLAGMRLTTGAFAAMTAELRQVAAECCGGRLVAITEGGYDLPALAESMQAVVDVLAGERAAPARWPPSEIPSSRGRQAVDAVRSAAGRFWRL
jgi:acetoin utilization deacetylase AcuC-like enzyme